MKVYEAVGSVGSQAKARLLLIKILFLKPLEIFFSAGTLITSV